MAHIVRYRCPTCESMVEMRDSEGKLTEEASVPCPKLGCTDKAKKIWAFR